VLTNGAAAGSVVVVVDVLVVDLGVFVMVVDVVVLVIGLDVDVVAFGAIGVVGSELPATPALSAGTLFGGVVPNGVLAATVAGLDETAPAPAAATPCWLQP
jgi:hypothetical protein